MNKIYNTLFFLCFSLFSFGQDFQLGLSLGLVNYQGDIAARTIWSPEDFNLGANIFIKKNFSPQWSAKASLFFSLINGSDFNHTADGEWRARRGYSFETPIQEFTITAEWNIFDRKKTDHQFHPYILLGGGVLFSNPTKTNPQTHFVLPIGAGFYVDIDDQIIFGMEVSSHSPFTDQLDAFSDDGFSEGNDWFLFANANISYRFVESNVRRNRRNGRRRGF